MTLRFWLFPLLLLGLLFQSSASPAGILGESEVETILPIVVTGVINKESHFQSTLTIQNLAESAVDVTLELRDGSGTLQHGFFCTPVQQIPMIVTIPAKGSFHGVGITDQPLFGGWMRIVAPAGAQLFPHLEVSVVHDEPEPCLVICNRPSGQIKTSASVAGTEPSSEFSAAAIRTDHRESAYAVVNPTDQPVLVEIISYDPSGAIFDSNEVLIEPFGQIRKFWFNLMIFGKVFIVPPDPPEVFHGSIRFRSVTPIAVSGFHMLFPEGKLVNIPVKKTSGSLPDPTG